MANIPYPAYAIGSVLLLIWLLKVLKTAYQTPLRHIPGPWYSPLTALRLKLSVITGRRLHYIHALHQVHGPIVRISPTELSISDPLSFKEIHRVGSGFLKSDWYRDLSNWEGEGQDRVGVFAESDVRKHAERRKMFARPFSKTALRAAWEGVVYEKVKVAVRRIKEEARTFGSADVLKWWTFLATDVSAQLMFGESFAMLERGEKNQYIKVLESTMMGSGIRVELPLVAWIGKWIPTEAAQTMFRANEALLRYGTQAVENAYQTEGSAKTNIFSTMLGEVDKGEKQLDELDVRMEAGNLIIAGSDTTGVTLTYLIWAVLSRPDLRRELEEEVSQVEVMTDAELEKLPFLNAVIEETLRLYGAAPGSLPRIVPKHGATLDGHFVPGGTTVSTQSYTIHRDPTLFPEPERFLPHRWLPDHPQAPTILAKSVFSPFGAGSRICLGIHLARMELRLAAAEFFKQCKGARLASSTTPESMEFENFFLVTPMSHRCDITV